MCVGGVTYTKLRRMDGSWCEGDVCVFFSLSS